MTLQIGEIAFKVLGCSHGMLVVVFLDLYESVSFHLRPGMLKKENSLFKCLHFYLNLRPTVLSVLYSNNIGWTHLEASGWLFNLTSASAEVCESTLAMTNADGESTFDGDF